MPHEWSSDLSERVEALNTRALLRDGARYVLVWPRYALRAWDNPLLDAGIDLANTMDLPVLIAAHLSPDYPYASDRLHAFRLGAMRDMARGAGKRGLRMVTSVTFERGRGDEPIQRLAQEAAAVLTDTHFARWAQDEASAFAKAAGVAVYGVDAARLVPTRVLPEGLATTPAFRKANGAERITFEAAARDLVATTHLATAIPPTESIPLVDLEATDFDLVVARSDVDHSLPQVPEFEPTRDEAKSRLARFVADALPKYPWRRNNPADASAVSTLSPYLHFGLIGPREITAAVREADTYAKSKWKFLDELLTWREWFHYRAYHEPNLDQFDALPARPRQSLVEHAGDPRPELYGIAQLLHGQTSDPVWNAAQKQWLLTGYMHNNLRMYWGKQILKWTPDPATAWKFACYINDRLAFDGRDPATYGNMGWVFGMAKPAWREQPIYGWVAPKSDRALRKRDGFDAWVADWSTRDVPMLDLPPEDIGAAA